MNKVINMDRTH